MGRIAHASELIPTIKIKDGDDYIIINACDFDPSLHEEYQPERSQPEEAAAKRGPGRPRKSGPAAL